MIDNKMININIRVDGHRIRSMQLYQSDQYSSNELLSYIVIGDAQTGKSQLCRMLTDRHYIKDLKQGTVRNYEFSQNKIKGIDIRIMVRDYGKIKLSDLSGDKISRQYLNVYLSQYQQVNGIIFVFDVTNLKTLNNFKKWIRELQIKVKNIEPAYSRQSSLSLQDEQDQIKNYHDYIGFDNEVLSQIPFLLVGTKFDCITAERREYIKRKIHKQINSLFTGDNNVHLISTKQPTIESIQHLESAIQTLYQKDYFVKLNALTLLDLKLESRFRKTINNYYRLICSHFRYCIRKILGKKKY